MTNWCTPYTLWFWSWQWLTVIDIEDAYSVPLNDEKNGRFSQRWSPGHGEWREFGWGFEGSKQPGFCLVRSWFALGSPVASGKHTKSYWTLPFMVDLPIKYGDFFFNVKLPEGSDGLTLGSSTLEKPRFFYWKNWKKLEFSQNWMDMFSWRCFVKISDPIVELWRLCTHILILASYIVHVLAPD